MPPWLIDVLVSATGSLVGAFVGVLIGLGVSRFVTSRWFGPGPKFALDPATEEGPLWIHVSVRNIGLPHALRTAVAERVIAKVEWRGRSLRMLWESTSRDNPRALDIYPDEPERIPLAFKNVSVAARTDYGNFMPSHSSHLTDSEFLSQGWRRARLPWGVLGHYYKPAPNQLEVGEHKVKLTVRALDGTTATREFTLAVPAGSAPLRLL